MSWLHPATTLALALLIGGVSASADEPPGSANPVRQEQEQTQVKQRLILAHYMPWYSAKPFSEQWGWHWTMNHFDPERTSGGRREIASEFYPLIGPYDSGDPQVLEYHLLLMKLAGIDGVIVDWYGLEDYRDCATLHRNTERLVQQVERLKMKLVICYEDQTIVTWNASNKYGEITSTANSNQDPKICEFPFGCGRCGERGRSLRSNSTGSFS